MRYVLAAIIKGFESSRHKKTFKKLCTGDGAGAVIPAGSKLGSGAGAEKGQISWARLFANEKYFFFLRVLTPIVSCNKTKHLTSSLLIKVLSSMYMKKQRWLPPTSIDAARESSAAFEGLSNNAHYGWILNCLVGL